MENLSNTITDIIIDNNNIIITYDNDMVESIVKSYDSYMIMNQTWLKNEPMFISDKFKLILYDLSSINVHKNSINNLNEFFVESNSENVKKFFIYMRGRKEYLALEKLKWTIK